MRCLPLRLALLLAAPALASLRAADTDLAPTALPATPDLPAFPGAEGFGATTPGGRGGRVIFVTTLDDSGPGSFRAACEAEGPRIVIFRVGGTIRLQRPITVTQPYLTIAGQTAPGDGICLRDATFGIATHDVVVRHLRSRLGDETARQEDCIGLFNGSRNVVLDHCSATWSIDECLSLSGRVSNVTVQWCLIGEALRQSRHAKGAHGFGSLSRANGPVTWHHNLWVHNDSRNPRLGDDYGRGPTFPTFDVRHNVIYNFGQTASGLTQGRLEVNYVGNVILPGPDSKARTPISLGAPSEIAFFIRDNVFEGNADLTRDNTGFFRPADIPVRLVETPFAAPRVTATPANDAVEFVLATVGASRPRRDQVDARLVADVRARDGRIIDSQTEVGGWPELTHAPAPVDTDSDGMPDAWETKHGLDPRSSVDANADRDGDGYTNVEEFLNDTSPREFIDYRW